ncbi:DNA replication protein psf2 [Thoreauomyces humboldtii]|nr:DNA replication protein psf2 [Thoreauomyces humboldtii]
MALPRNLRNALAPAEVEFLAEGDPISILPLHKMEALQLINGTYGPFRPPHKQEVPLWLAVTLKRKQKCQIIAPDWMEPEYLRKKLEEENADAEFSALPFRFMEISHLLLGCASDDIPQSEVVRTLLKDLREARQGKARRGLRGLDAHYLQTDNLGLMEINEVRPFFARAFNELRNLEPVAEPGAGSSQATTGAGSSALM